MFDDQPINNARSQVPGNLPMKEPEDILASTEGLEAVVSPDVKVPNVDQTPAEPSSKQISVEPATSALDAGVLKPKVGTVEPALPRAEAVMTSPPPPTPAPERPAGMFESAPTISSPEAPGTAPSIPAQPEIYKIKEPVLSKGKMGIIVTLVVVLIVIGGGWLVYAKFIRANEKPDILDSDLTGQRANYLPDEESLATEPVIKSEDDEEPEVTGQMDITPEIIDEQVLFGEPIDTDEDRLDDIREEDIGTNPNNWDTDGDELSDGDEVIIWKTDPLDSDTDGDGYLDGEEVKAGYNPTGSGRFLEVTTTP